MIHLALTVHQIPSLMHLSISKKVYSSLVGAAAMLIPTYTSLHESQFTLLTPHKRYCSPSTFIVSSQCSKLPNYRHKILEISSIEFTKPRNPLTSLQGIGRGNSFTAFTLQSLGLTLSHDSVCPRYSTLVWAKEHFSGCSLKLASSNCFSTCLMYSRCSWYVCDTISKSCRYTNTKCHLGSVKS